MEVELGGKGGSFLIVRDNGKGMNASDLKDFATYFLTQVSASVVSCCTASCRCLVASFWMSAASISVMFPCSTSASSESFNRSIDHTTS